jgi:hypothetical protein
MWCWRRIWKIGMIDGSWINPTYRQGEKEYIQLNGGRRTGLVTYCVKAASFNTLLKEDKSDGKTRKKA